MGHRGFAVKSSSVLRGIVAAGVALAVSACASLPSSGPTGRQIQKESLRSAENEGYRLVEVATLADLPPASKHPPEFSKDYVPARATDLIGPGDVLDIAIYESGISLFGGIASPAAASAAGFDPTSKVERLPPSRVADNGTVRIPYVGEIVLAGHTTAEAAGLVRRALRGMSQNPQVLVSIREGMVNSVIIGGEVGRPGRLVLTTDRAPLSDVIALAGGQRGNVKDMTVRVQRRGVTVEVRLSDILGVPENDFSIFPGDQISVYSRPRSFSVMGAAGRADQVPFSGPTVSLAEALAASGGVNPNLGDPKAIFVFRYVADQNGVAQPVIYHVNLMKAGSYFLAQQFAMNDRDLLYVGNAEANQPSKFVQIVSQLFAPIVTIRNVVN